MIKNQWYGILPSAQIKKNTIVAVRRLNLDLALFRTAKGKIGCVADRCSHRGAALSAGRVTGDCIKCPFHGLEFDAAGACRFIPANGKAYQGDLSRFNLKRYPVREAHGIVYLWYGDPEKAAAKLPFFRGNDESWVYSEIEDHWNSHYSRSIENQLDVIHLPFVHHNTIGAGNMTLINGPKYEFADGELRTSGMNEKDHGQKPKLPSECVIRDQCLRFIFPNIWLNDISPGIKVMIYFAPVDEENTILYIRFYCRASRLRPVNQFIAFWGRYANLIIERQDKRVVITQLPKASSLRSPEQLLMGDGPVVMYRKIRDELKQRSDQLGTQ